MQHSAPHSAFAGVAARARVASTELALATRAAKDAALEAMAAALLDDTGAILASLDQNDRWHEPCVASLSTLRLPLATSAAVLTELFHLLRNHPRQKAMAWNFRAFSRRHRARDR